MTYVELFSNIVCKLFSFMMEVVQAKYLIINKKKFVVQSWMIGNGKAAYNERKKSINRIVGGSWVGGGGTVKRGWKIVLLLFPAKSVQ